jgi:hypothetical protein
MNRATVLLLLLGFTACNILSERNTKVFSDQEENCQIEYSEEELIGFLDSIGQLNPEVWQKGLSIMVDSVLTHQIDLDHQIAASDFEELKEVATSQIISHELAKRVFPLIILRDLDFVSHDANKIHIGFYSFDETIDEFTQFAISIGPDGMNWCNLVYFFYGDRVVSKHDVYHRYGIDINHFRDTEDRVVIYYKVNFQSGTGLWWHQNNFYAYNDNKLVPVLTEVHNINLQLPWGIRTYWVKSEVVNKNPLQIKFVYDNQFYDTILTQVEFINDSTIVTYYIDGPSGKFIPEFRCEKLSSYELFTYFHNSHELLFVNTYYEKLKEALNGADFGKKRAILFYLNTLKNWFNSTNEEH